MYERLKDILTVIKDCGIIIGLPAVIAIGVRLYEVQIDFLSQQIKANEANIKVLEAQNGFLKDTQFDRALAMIKSQKELYEMHIASMQKILDETQMKLEDKQGIQRQLDEARTSLKQNDTAIALLLSLGIAYYLGNQLMQAPPPTAR